MSHDDLYQPNDIRRAEAIAAMTTTFRLHPRPDFGWGVHEELQMWHQNEWWWVARTDLIDDICTGRIEKDWTLDEWIAHYKAKVAKSYGARLKRDPGRDFPCFAVIDSLTDG